MHRSSEPLIVGAGPVGLAAALFLTRQGCTPRVIEMRQEASKQSRALAVNPRTLDILRPTGVTQRMLDIGLPVRGGRFYRRTRNVATVSFDGIHPHYPFLLALSQAATERLLAESLERAGGKVGTGEKIGRVSHVGRGSRGGHRADGRRFPRSRAVARGCWQPTVPTVSRDNNWRSTFPVRRSRSRGIWPTFPCATALAPDHAHVFLPAASCCSWSV